MGQQPSLPHDQSLKNEAISFQLEKIKFAQRNPSFIEFAGPEESCMAYFCNFQPKKTEKWKTETIKQLKNLKAEHWPSVLIRILKQTNNPKLDTLYQADIYYMINKTNLSEISPVRESSPSLKDSFKSLRPDIKFSTAYVPVSIYTASRGPDQLESRRSESVNDRREKNCSIKREENLANKSFTMKRSEVSSELPTDSFVYNQGKDDRETLKNSFSSRVMRIGRTSTKIQLLDKQYQTSVQRFSIRETEFNFTHNNGCRMKFEATINLLQKHLSDADNIFYKLIAAFEDYLVERFGNFEKRREIRGDTEEFLNRAVSDTNQFLDVLSESVRSFYGLHRIRKHHVQEYDFIFSRDNLTNALTSIVFNRKIHNILLELHRAKNLRVESFCAQSFNAWKSLDPQYFGVQDRYALNQKTIQSLQQNDESVTFGNDDTFVKQDDKSSGIKFNLQVESVGEASIHEKMVLQDNSISIDDTFKPYEKAIGEIRFLQNKAGPVEKLKVIIRVVELIHVSIITFYKNLGHKVEEALTIQELLPIIFYVIVKSGFYDIFTHAQFIKNFISKETLQAAVGEHLKIFEALENFLYTKTLRNSYNVETVGKDLQQFLSTSIVKVSSIGSFNEIKNQ